MTEHRTSDSIAERRRVAVARTRTVCATLEEMGVRTRIIGSLPTAHFGLGSDIDFLVVECPRSLKYGIEGTIEDGLDGLAFDVVYLDEIPEYKRDRFMKGAVDARYIR